MSLEPRPDVVMITGAAGALGRAVARAFADRGAALVLLDRDEATLRAAFPGGDGEHPGRLLAAADLADATAVQAAADAALARFGRIDVLCNIAGGFTMGEAVHETSDDTWARMFDLNARSVVHTARAVVPAMQRQGRGKVINVGANGAARGAAQMGAYAASKSAVARLTESMAAELREQGINVNCVLPSILDTPANRAAMPDADPARWVAPADLAAVVVFLASDAARAVHGASVPVVGLS
jgi:NAD(P)-dependent dehydrogenase (short-subunit alcohol dehydrogenase family)